VRRALWCGALVVLVGCGSSRTHIPDNLGTAGVGRPLLPGPVSSVPLDGETTTSSTVGSTTTSPFQTAGLKHTLANGGTVVVSYPNNAVRPPKDVPPAPADSAYAMLTVKMCADKAAAIPGELVGPSRFSVEVPGQGIVAYDPAVPPMRTPTLPEGTTVQPGTCLEGTVSFLIKGERHIESVSYDAGEGIFRWVS
jgi:hypothetical protein